MATKKDKGIEAKKSSPRASQKSGKKPTTSKKSKPALPLIGIIMGSISDLETMKPAAEALEEFGVPYEMQVVSAHRTPKFMVEYAESAAIRGLKVIIAGAGGAAHLPGMVASLTPLPVIGVPVASRHLQGLDSLLSIVQMPAGIPVATVSIGNGRNAGLLAVRILAASNPELLDKVLKFQKQLESKVLAMRIPKA